MVLFVVVVFYSLLDNYKADKLSHFFDWQQERRGKSRVVVRCFVSVLPEMPRAAVPFRHGGRVLSHFPFPSFWFLSRARKLLAVPSVAREDTREMVTVIWEWGCH